MTDSTSLTAQVIAAYVASNKISPSDLPNVIASVHTAISRAGRNEPEIAPEEDLTKSKADIKKSMTPDALISFIDGKPYRTLKRHLSTNGLTPAEYRERYGLKADYPMVAPSYAASRSEMAKRIGLGRKAGQTVKKAVTDATDAATAPVKAAGRKVRKTAAEAKQAATEHLG